MANLYLNLGINVADLYKDIDKAQLKQVEQAAAEGFSTDELKTLEEDGIDVSLIKDNAVEQPPIEEKETDSQELKDAKTKLKEINKQILNNTTELRELEADIILLEDEVNTEFENLVDKQKDLEEEQKEEIKEAQAKVQEKYASSEGEMTKEDYEESLSDEMDKLDSKFGTKFSSIAKDFAKNNKKSNELNEKIDTQSELVVDTENLKTEADQLSCEIQTKQKEHDAALAAAAAAGNGNGDGNGRGNGGDNPPKDIPVPGFIKDNYPSEYTELYKSLVSQGYNPDDAKNAVIHAGNAGPLSSMSQYYASGTTGKNAFIASVAGEYLSSVNAQTTFDPYAAAANAETAAMNASNAQAAERAQQAIAAGQEPPKLSAADQAAYDSGTASDAVKLQATGKWA